MTETTSASDPNDANSRLGNLLTIFAVALRLGLTSFGGPIAHIGFFRQEYVENRRWLSERRFSDLVALCHFLPGPTSSQVGIAVGITRGGLLGGLLAWIGFTAPSAAVLIAFGYGVAEFDTLVDGDWLKGLKIAAVAVVAQALWGMGTTLAPDKTRASVAVAAAIAILVTPICLQHRSGNTSRWSIRLVALPSLCRRITLRQRLIRNLETPCHRLRRPIRHPPDRPTLDPSVRRSRPPRCFRRLLPQRLASLRRRSRRPSRLANRSRREWMGYDRTIHRWVRRISSHSGPYLYICRLPWLRHECRTRRCGRRTPHTGRHILTIIPARSRHSPLLEPIERSKKLPRRADRHQRGSCRHPRRRLFRSRMDVVNQRTNRFRTRRCGLRSPHVLETSLMVGSHSLRCGWSGLSNHCMNPIDIRKSRYRIRQ